MPCDAMILGNLPIQYLPREKPSSFLQCPKQSKLFCPSWNILLDLDLRSETIYLVCNKSKCFCVADLPICFA